jgi:hypothetical protein
MTPDEWSDLIYEAAGLVVTREQALAIGQMVNTIRNEALDKAWEVVAACPVNDDGLSYFELLNRDTDMMLGILALKKEPRT